MPAGHFSHREASLVSLTRLRQTLKVAGGPVDLSDHQLRSLSPVALAYLGDAVYELFVRSTLLIPPKRLRTYHQAVVSQVKAERQSFYLQQLTPLLSEAERDILRRGRNASPKGPKRLDRQTYQQATGFEALIGYLYLTNPDRLVELLSHLDVTPSDESQDK